MVVQRQATVMHRNVFRNQSYFSSDPTNIGLWHLTPHGNEIELKSQNTIGHMNNGKSLTVRVSSFWGPTWWPPLMLVRKQMPGEQEGKRRIDICIYPAFYTSLDFTIILSLHIKQHKWGQLLSQLYLQCYLNTQTKLFLQNDKANK